jgi:hypothetical protein
MVMKRRKGTKNFYADVDITIRKSFAKQWKDRDMSNNSATTAALKLWLSLPREVQAIILHYPDSDVQTVADFLASRLREGIRKSLIHEELSDETR